MNKKIKMLVIALLLLVVPIAFSACGNSTIAVESISINGSDIAIVNVGEQYTATVSPDNATNKSVAWEVVSGTATISQNGLLTATAIGMVTIKATVDGKSDTKQITVNETCFGTFEYSTTIEGGVLLTNRLILNEDYTGKLLALFDGVEVGGHYSHDITFTVDGNNFSYTIGDESPINGTFSNNFTKLTLNVGEQSVALDKAL